MRYFFSPRFISGVVISSDYGYPAPLYNNEIKSQRIPDFMHKKIFIVINILIFMLFFTGMAPADTGGAETVKFGRYPAPSPDGRTLAFSWAGSIWTVGVEGGRATRITASDGYDWNPIWSPDGRKIAFMSNRFGSECLFIVDSKGGTPQQCTFSSNNDFLSGWTPDGKSLIFSSRRGGRWPDYRSPHILDISAERGEGPSAPRQFVPCPAYGAVISPDGEVVAFEFGPGNGYRQGYKGTRSQSIWLYFPENGRFEQVTFDDVPATDPQWSADGRKLYFRSERGGVGNLWMLDRSDGEIKKVTNVTGSGLWHPRTGGPTGAEIVAYQWGNDIWVQNIPDGRPRKVEIQAWLDENPDTPENRVFTSSASEYALSPDGVEVAFVVRGEIFCVRADGVGGTEAARLTNHPARDWQISWYPRGDSILFTSDRDGVEQLYRVSSDDPDHERLSESRRFKVERLTNVSEPCWLAVFAPVPKENKTVPANNELVIGYIRNTGDLWLMDGNGENQRNLFKHWDMPNFSFSPDGRWLAYSRQDEDYNSDIFIAAVNPDDPYLPNCPRDGWQAFPGRSGARGLVPSWADGEVNITRHPDDDFYPVWSPDGSKIGFTSIRYFDNVDAYFVFLKKADDERLLRLWEAQAEPLPALPDPPVTDEEDEPEDETEADEPEEDTAFRVDIDFDRIHHRARRLTTHPGNETLRAFSPDGKTIVYTSDSDGSLDIWQIDWTGRDEKSLTNNASPDQILWHEKANRIVYMSGGKISSVKPGGGDSKTHAFTARMTIDPLSERMHKFHEAWRLQNIWFYDENFHGRDWPALRNEYEPLAQASRHYRDFNDVINMMYG
ncbi:MAG TPA: hypothetical protein ENN67_07730, partial [Firmicutes bacterium]|nr:hypothetical protein [Bacillota bacterium]